MIAAGVMAMAAGKASGATEKTVVRIAEIETEPDRVRACRTILAEEQEASVRLEPGLSCCTR
jgi:hypothetical protein